MLQALPDAVVFEPKRGDDKRPTSINLGQDLLRRIDQRAAKLNITRSDLVRQVMEQWCKEQDEKEREDSKKKR